MLFVRNASAGPPRPQVQVGFHNLSSAQIRRRRRAHWPTPILRLTSTEGAMTIDSRADKRFQASRRDLIDRMPLHFTTCPTKPGPRLLAKKPDTSFTPDKIFPAPLCRRGKRPTMASPTTTPRRHHVPHAVHAGPGRRHRPAARTGPGRPRRRRSPRRPRPAEHSARAAPLLPGRRHGRQPAQGAAASLRTQPEVVQAAATSRSATAARRCSSPSTRGSPTTPPRAWAPASSNATSPSRRTRNWSAATRRTTCTPPPTSWPRRWPRTASSPSRRRPSTPTATCVTPASAECRTSDITLAEFKTLRGKMDASNPRARTVAEYLGGTADLPHRPLLRPDQRHAADAQGEHRAVQATSA